MSVGRRLMLSLITLVACTALLGAAAVFGLVSLSRHYQAAEDQYKALRSVYEIGFQAASVRQLLAGAPRDDEAIRHHLYLAAQAAESLTAGASGERFAGLHQSIADRLASVSEAVDPASGTRDLEADANAWLSQVASMVAGAQTEIIENRREASARFESVLIAMVVAFAVTVIAAVAVGVRQYRSVMGPLGAFDRALGELADIRLGHRIEEHGDLEFRRLMHHFNRMSEAIEHLHASMHRQVEMKSRQLVRSEQLASVGTLAAGLAHEINNPLGIIAGYAQSSLRRLERAQSPAQRAEAVERAGEALRVIAEESFRCRDIALQLVRMAQPDGGDAEPMDVRALVLRAIDLVSRLPIAQGKEIVRRSEAGADAVICRGHPSQMLQVLINLLTNALESSAPGSGRIEVAIVRDLDMVRIDVRDNGRGMTQEALAHAFDPFYTDKPRRGLDGCGLGLSISHAIIERNAGRLYAHSGGPGLGATFTIELPALEPAHLEQEPAHA